VHSQVAAKPLVLIVEDSEDHVFLLRLAFERAGIGNPVRAVSSGEEAIAYLGGTGGFFDRAMFPLPLVVLLDLKMPGKDGLEVLEWIRKQPGLKGLMVVMLSSSDLARDVNLAYELGVNAFLTKPIDLDRLVEMMRAFRDFFLCAATPPDVSRGKELNQAG
jgi:CheY-like chemotaxis protein